MPFSMTITLENLLTSLQISKVSTKQENLSTSIDGIHSLVLACKQIVTLQVRILISQLNNILSDCHGKKAFPSVPASLTLEAVMCLTLFIFASVCLILPMKIMTTERKIQAALEEIGEDFSRYAYVKDAMEKNKWFSSAETGDFAQNFTKYLVSGVAQGYAEVQVMSHVDTKAMKHMRMLRSQVLEDGETIDLILDYEIRFPFPLLGLLPLQKTSRCKRRAWIGKEGKDYDGSGGLEEDSDEIVYIGKSSTRYHKSRSCHYLANKSSGVPLNQVESLRNDSGGKYYPCSVCGKNAGNTVYIMSNGKSYHATQNCTAIVAYARAVRLSEVEHLGPCSYCGGK